jgi:hypothetical protein
MQSVNQWVGVRRRLNGRAIGLHWGTVGGLLIVAMSLQAESPIAVFAEQQEANAEQQEANTAADQQATPTQPMLGDEEPAAVIAARQRAELLHAVYAETLHVMHERYFHGSRAIVPARAMEDIFKTMKRQSGVEASWMSVNVRAMSIHHEPKTEFERDAAKQIAAGQSAVEVIADGYYRRAGAIEMTAGCVACHDGFGKPPTKVPKFAALVISVPLSSEPAEGLDSLEQAPASE